MSDTTETTTKSRFDAEISKMLTETAKIAAETSRINAELQAHPWSIENNKITAEIAKITAETSRINAETSRINAELKAHPWLPLLSVIIGSGGISAVVAAVVTVLFSMMHH